MNLPNVEYDEIYNASHSGVNSDTHFGVISGVSDDGPGMPEDDGEKRGKPGPEPDRLKIDVPFEKGLRRALKKKKPKEGWPEPDEPQPDNGP